jgi:tRNA(Ile2) C34 agmatinyltransferase TiaS
MQAQCHVCSYTAMNEAQWTRHLESNTHFSMTRAYEMGMEAQRYQSEKPVIICPTEHPLYYQVLGEQAQEIAALKDALEEEKQQRELWKQAFDEIFEEHNETRRALKDNVIALRFYSQWMTDKEPGTLYPFGETCKFETMGLIGETLPADK